VIEYIIISVLTLISIVVLILYLFQRYEIRKLKRELSEIRGEASNSLLHFQGKSTEQLVNEINLMLSELHEIRAAYRKRDRSFKRMLTNFSHDLRTPLTSSLGYIQLLQKSNMPEDEKERELEIVEKRLCRLEELINSCFELSKIVSSDKMPELNDLSLASVLEESVAHYYDDFSDKSRKISLAFEGSKAVLLSNRDILMRIFDNLIGNAYKHGNSDLNITVKNNGGISVILENETDEKPDVQHLFDEFYTADSSRSKGNSGLGLVIAKEFTELLGGNISVQYEGRKIAFILSFESKLPGC